MKNYAKIIIAGIVSILFLSGISSVSAIVIVNETELLASRDQVPVGVVTWDHPTSYSRYIYITYTAYEGWVLNKMHLAVADTFDGIPHTNLGDPDMPADNPKVGQFPYFSETGLPPVTEYTFEIDLENHNILPDADGKYLGTLFVAARAVVHNTVEGCGIPPAWADEIAVHYNDPDAGVGEGHGPGNWALWFQIELI